MEDNKFFNFDSPVVNVDMKSYNKAIDDFTERLKKDGIEQGYHCNDYVCEFCSGDCDICEDNFKKEIDIMAEEMKRGANETDI